LIFFHTSILISLGHKNYLGFLSSVFRSKLNLIGIIFTNLRNYCSSLNWESFYDFVFFKIRASWQILFEWELNVFWLLNLNIGNTFSKKLLSSVFYLSSWWWSINKLDLCVLYRGFAFLSSAHRFRDDHTISWSSWFRRSPHFYILSHLKYQIASASDTDIILLFILVICFLKNLWWSIIHDLINTDITDDAQVGVHRLPLVVLLVKFALSLYKGIIRTQRRFTTLL
jgi:hypothetical protein